MSIGLVIQGPLLSTGLSGETAGHGKTRVKSERFVEYNCVSNVSNQIEKASEIFDYIVLSTWKGSNKVIELKDKFPLVDVLELEDPLGGKTSPKKGGTTFKDSQARQFFSTLEGLNLLESKGCDYALKIRTDQFMDMKELIKSFNRFMSSNRMFFVPYLRGDIPTIIPDFYMGGRTKDLQCLSDLLCSQTFRFHRNVHRDIFWKSMLLQKEVISKLNPFHLIFEGHNFSLDAAIIVKDNLESVFYPSSRQLYNTLIWRGAAVKSAPGQAYFEREMTAFCNEMFTNDSYSLDFGLITRNVLNSDKILLLIVKTLIWRTKYLLKKLRNWISYQKNRKIFKV